MALTLAPGHEHFIDMFNNITKQDKDKQKLSRKMQFLLKPEKYRLTL